MDRILSQTEGNFAEEHLGEDLFLEGFPVCLIVIEKHQFVVEPALFAELDVPIKVC
jgi:hypothetical protein